MPDLAAVINDLRVEGDELYTFLLTIDEEDWGRATTFKNWTVNDVVQHLYFGDYLGMTSHKNGADFLTFMATVQASNQSLVDYTRAWLKGESGVVMLERWHGQFSQMCDLFAASDPGMRLTWAGPDMGLKMFATARLMETWAHGWEIYDLLKASREHTDRIRHVAAIGVKTYGWTFANRDMEPPGSPPYLKLNSPSGANWEWNTPQDDNRITGEAVEFCQVVTQVRNIADTDLAIKGEPAKQWMAIAQCFAGPPEQPPAKGMRVSE